MASNANDEQAKKRRDLSQWLKAWEEKKQKPIRNIEKVLKKLETLREEHEDADKTLMVLRKGHDDHKAIAKKLSDFTKRQAHQRQKADITDEQLTNAKSLRFWGDFVNIYTQYIDFLYFTFSPTVAIYNEEIGTMDNKSQALNKSMVNIAEYRPSFITQEEVQMQLVKRLNESTTLYTHSRFELQKLTQAKDRETRTLMRKHMPNITDRIKLRKPYFENIQKGIEQYVNDFLLDDRTNFNRSKMIAYILKLIKSDDTSLNDIINVIRIYRKDQSLQRETQAPRLQPIQPITTTTIEKVLATQVPLLGEQQQLPEPLPDADEYEGIEAAVEAFERNRREELRKCLEMWIGDGSLTETVHRRANEMQTLRQSDAGMRVVEAFKEILPLCLINSEIAEIHFQRVFQSTPTHEQRENATDDFDLLYISAIFVEEFVQNIDIEFEELSRVFADIQEVPERFVALNAEIKANSSKIKFYLPNDMQMHVLNYCKSYLKLYRYANDELIKLFPILDSMDQKDEDLIVKLEQQLMSMNENIASILWDTRLRLVIGEPIVDQDPVFEYRSTMMQCIRVINRNIINAYTSVVEIFQLYERYADIKREQNEPEVPTVMNVLLTLFIRELDEVLLEVGKRVAFVDGEDNLEKV